MLVEKKNLRDFTLVYYFSKLTDLGVYYRTQTH